MSETELNIKNEDWLRVLIVAVVFSSMISVLFYLSNNLPLLDGAVFGVVCGFIMSLFSMIFITINNELILPRIPKSLWSASAAVFSFLSGFLGILFTVFFSSSIHLILPSILDKNILFTAVIVGALTYMIGVLIYLFVKMRNEKELAQKHLMESRLLSLETQLNPHFLFNALSSIAELIHLDANKAESAIITMSKFLRQAMKESGQVTLAEEIESVTRYVELENLRFDGKVKLNVNYNSSDKSILVPKFSIQLLVENAIKHGYNPASKSLNINITSSGNKIVVQNDGLPIDEMIFGVGLRNLRERLEFTSGGSLNLTNRKKPTFEIIL